jgi:shikimate kinase
MTCRGRARAPAAGTICNAFATGTGAAFAIDRHTEATVTLSGSAPDSRAPNDSSGASELNVVGAVAGAPDADTRLVERCVSLVVATFGGEGSDIEHGRVETDSDVTMAAGLKSSSAAANAVVLATLDALGVSITDPSDERAGDDDLRADDAGDTADERDADREYVDGDGSANGTEDQASASRTETESEAGVTRAEACRLGVRAAREVGVTVTGAFDDASASMLGGVTVTDNADDRLLAHDREFDRSVLVWTPSERAYSADADVERCRRIAPVAEGVVDLALDGAYERAMTTNGLAYCAALGYSPEPMIEALADVRGVSLSGTGPSMVAVGERAALEAVKESWSDREGRTWLTRTNPNGATTA